MWSRNAKQQPKMEASMTLTVSLAILLFVDDLRICLLYHVCKQVAIKYTRRSCCRDGGSSSKESALMEGMLGYNSNMNLVDSRKMEDCIDLKIYLLAGFSTCLLPPPAIPALTKSWIREIEYVAK